MKKFTNQAQTNQLNESSAWASSSFSFQMNMLNGKTSLSSALGSYLEMDQLQINYNRFMDYIPREEFEKVHGIHQILLVFFNAEIQLRYKCHFKFVHSLQLKNKENIRLLRELHFSPVQQTGSYPICHNHCVDITNVHFTNGVHFDLRLMDGREEQKTKAMNYFLPILKKTSSIFSERELEILKVWKDNDSIDLASRKLNITTRTLETHLRNMRKRLQVKRSMDVLIYATERKLI